jgi:hypothetical protein
LKYGGNNTLLNDLTNSSDQNNGAASDDLNDRQSGKEEEEGESFMAIQARIKEKYGIGIGGPNDHKKSPEISPDRIESISSRYEKLTGRSPSADLLASSLDDLLKSLKNKFKNGAPSANATGNEESSTNPIDTIQKLLIASSSQ